MIVQETERRSTGTYSESEFTLSRISEKNMPHIMGLLSGAYTMPLDAVVREITANGRDSHNAAGVTRPVFVTLPTPENPNLVISDEGTGLDTAGVVYAFSEYGESSRREDADAAGFFGNGSKSPLAVTDQYTVEAVKDGLRTLALFVRLANGAPGHKIIETGPTDQPNGVTVTVPVDPNATAQWREAVLRVLYAQDPGSALITNEAEHTVLSDHRDAVLSTDEVTVIDFTTRVRNRENERYRSGYNLVRMGQITYALPATMHREKYGYAYGGGGGLIFEVPLGCVKLHQSREAIEDTTENRELLRAAYDRWANEMRERYNTALRGATTLLELERVYEKVPTILADSGILGHEDFGGAREMAKLPQDIESPTSLYAVDLARTMERGLNLERARMMVAKGAVVLREDEHTPATVSAIRRWRRTNLGRTLFVANEKRLAPILDPAELTWITAEEIREQAHGIKELPTLSDSDVVVTPWSLNRTRYSRHEAVKRTEVGEIRRAVTEGSVLVVGTRTQFRKFPGWTRRSDAINDVKVLLGTASLKEMETLLGLPAITPQAYEDLVKYDPTSDYEKEVQGFSPSVRQYIVDRDLLGRGVGYAVQLLESGEITNPDHIATLKAMAALDGKKYQDKKYSNNQWRTHLVKVKGMPKPSKAFALPMTVELFNTVRADPSAALFAVVIQADMDAIAAKKAERAKGAAVLAAATKKGASS